MPGERIGGRRKGTPNKMPPEFGEAVIAAAAAIGMPKRVGKLWVATGERGEVGFFLWIFVNYPKIAMRLYCYIFDLEEDSRARSRARARASLFREVLKLLMVPVELKPSHKTAHPSCVVELLDALARSVVR